MKEFSAAGSGLPCPPAALKKSDPQNEIRSYIDRLWPLPRSITGNGLRDSLTIMQELIPLELHEVKTGTKIFDWTVPSEWNIIDAYILDPDGVKIVDFHASNLHVVSYSIAVNRAMELAELDTYLHSLPEQPDAIPYVTSYYQKRWGFCLSHKQRRSLKKGTYRVVIDSTLCDGSLTYGDAYLPSTEGENREILISSYLCHPSMANNELTGPLCAAFLFRKLAAQSQRRFNYRFFIGPETIGALAYLSQHGDHLKQFCHAGLVVTCCGSEHDFTYKRSRRGTSIVDRCVRNSLGELAAISKRPFTIVDFAPEGSDERQYCSPGFNLPIGSLMRAMYGTYPEYHTSLDNRSFVSPAAMLETVEVYHKCIQAIEMNRMYLNLQPYGEPNLGSRGLYPLLGNVKSRSDQLRMMMFILNYSDGNYDLCEIAEKAGGSLTEAYSIAETLREKGLLKLIPHPPADEKRYGD